MSSFNINGPSNRPQITEAQSMMNNGGAGNTGYMASGKKKKKKDEEEEFDPAILEENIEDSFEHSKSDDDEDDDYYNHGASKAAKGKEASGSSANAGGVKGMVFGLINKVAKAADGAIDKVVEKNKKNDDDEGPGGDFLTLSGKDL